MNIGLLGYGTVGAGVDELLSGHGSLCVSKIYSRTYKPEMGSRAVRSFEALLEGDSIDVIVELIGGLHPAYEYVSAALSAGKHVVTANKALIAAFYPDLASSALKQNVSLRFSAAAGGGIPWLNSLQRAASVDRILSVRGVMNGTTNFILDRMTGQGASYASALSKAQELGFAEADPSSDVDGLDTRRKLLLSVLTGFGLLLQEEEIPAFGISHVSAEDVAEAKAEGAVIRLIGEAFLTPSGNPAAFVVPEFCPASSPEAALQGCENRFSYRGEGFGVHGFTGEGAGRYPTALNVIRDLTDLETYGTGSGPASWKESAVDKDTAYRFYVRDERGKLKIRASMKELEQEYSGRTDVFIARIPERES